MPKLFFDLKLQPKKVVVYPKLPSEYDFGFLRFRGSGLANCLFIFARAYLVAHRNKWDLINPTWGNLVFGPYLRNEKDKRHYFGLFKKSGISGHLKVICLIFFPTITYESAIKGKKGKVIVEGLGNYFEDLLYSHEKVKKFIYSFVNKKAITKLHNVSFEDTIGVHVRLGDYSQERRISLNWYLGVIKEIINNCGSKYKIFVFSDGSNIELKDLLSLPNVERIFFGNSISDLIALGKCKLIVGSDSTFSGWAAFLEQTPIIFPSKHFGKVLLNSDSEFIHKGDIEKLKLFLGRNI
jgi:hypothetical protein